MLITAPPDATDFASAADNLRTYALDQFNTAFKRVVEHPPTLPSEPSGKDREAAKAWAADLAEAQGRMAAAFSQIADVERQKAEAAGYASIVALMATTATTADTIATRITGLMGTGNANPVPWASVDEINALNASLTALAALSPASLWEKAPAEGTTE